MFASKKISIISKTQVETVCHIIIYTCSLYIVRIIVVISDIVLCKYLQSLAVICCEYGTAPDRATNT